MALQGKHGLRLSLQVQVSAGSVDAEVDGHQRIPIINTSLIILSHEKFGIIIRWLILIIFLYAVAQKLSGQLSRQGRR